MKVQLYLPPYLYFVTTLPSKTPTTAHIAMLHFHNICNIAKFGQNKLVLTSVLHNNLLIHSNAF